MARLCYILREKGAIFLHVEDVLCEEDNNDESKCLYFVRRMELLFTEM